MHGGKSRPIAAIAPLIVARGLCKIYRVGEQRVRALDSITFAIHQGEYVAIVGPSGSGKSTLMHLIGALDVPTSGELRVDNCDIAQLPSDALAAFRNRTIGFVFQQFNLLPRTTALHQVMLPLLYAKPRLAHTEGLARARLLEVGLSDRLYHGPQQLSGGEQQRVAIARALVNNPRLLLADEPTGALDTKVSEEIMELFSALNRQGNTIVLVTHDMNVASHARRRILLRDGAIVEDVWQAHLGRPVYAEVAT